MTEASPPLPRLAPREADSHKGTYGTALLIGGSRGMTGAITLAGLAALRGGAGLVRLATPDECVAIVASAEPAYMTVPLPSDAAGRIRATAKAEIANLASRATAVACGPGWGRSAGLDLLGQCLFECLPQPAVFDADALNALAARKDSLPKRRGTQRGPRVLTPHPGEFGRLLGIATADVQAQRESLAKGFAAANQVTLVLKGRHTIITDGDRLAVNMTGNPGLATGGAGDVLTGLIAALLCQGLAEFEAARLGAYLHGLAGDLAAQRLGEVSMIASDLIVELPSAFRLFTNLTG